jgi:hypothetical protein
MYIGLTLLTHDLQASDNPKDIDRYDTLCDVSQACRAAVDILNDLLCFDKLESGILEVNKHEVRNTRRRAHIFIYIYMYKYIYIYVYTHTCVHISMHTYIFIYT